MRRLAPRWNLLDRPGGHKQHTEPVALGGGIAIAAALIGSLVGGFLILNVVQSFRPGWLGFLPNRLADYIPGLLGRMPMALGIGSGALILHILGVFDDKKNLGWLTKLAVQFAVAAATTLLLNLRLMTFLDEFPAGKAISIFITILWIVVITNAFNFLDNMDGLCAGVAAITAAIFGVSAIRAGQLFVPMLAFLMVGVMVGYLFHNFPPARIFMGDAGSLVIGYFMAILTILTTFWDQGIQRQPYGLLVPFVVLAVPLYDSASVVWIRLRLGVSPFHGDRRHFSHRLVQRGMSPRNAVLAIYLATGATSLGAALLPGADWTTACLILAQSLCVVLIIAVLEEIHSNEQSP